MGKMDVRSVMKTLLYVEFVPLKIFYDVRVDD